MSIYFCKHPKIFKRRIAAEIYDDRVVLNAEMWKNPDDSVITFEPATHLWSTLKARPDFSDAALFVFPLYPLSRLIGEPLNLYARTKATKSTILEESALSAANYSIHCYVPHRGATGFKDCSWVFHISEEGEFVCNLPAVEIPETPHPAHDALRMIFDAPDHVAVDGKLEGKILLTDKGGNHLPLSGVECFLETTAGYLPKQRLTFADGVADFTFAPLMLSAGDKLKIKVGFKHFTGVAEQHIEVV